MAENKSPSQASTLEKVFFGARRRLVASKLFFSKQLEEKRLEAIERGASRWKILRYQRIVDPAQIPFPLNAHSYVTPELFQVHVKYLARNCKVISLSRLVTMIEEYHEIPPRTVVLTFDGGHADTVLNGAPTLLKYNVPATFFLPTGYIESGTFTLDDKMVMALIILAKNKTDLPQLSSIDETLGAIYQNIIAAYPKLDRESISEFVMLARNIESTERNSLATTLFEAIQEIGDFPDFEDFARWNDLENLRSCGYEFGTLGTFLTSHPYMPPDQAISDLTQSILTLHEHSLSNAPLVAVPENMEVLYAQALLRKLEQRFMVTSFPFPEPRWQSELPMALGRIPISQLNASCLEIFAARVFEIVHSGIRY